MIAAARNLMRKLVRRKPTPRIAPAALESGPVDVVEARRLIEAIDRGGMPLNPARLRTVAAGLGLEVSRHASPEDTVRRIREALARAPA